MTKPHDALASAIAEEIAARHNTGGDPQHPLVRQANAGTAAALMLWRMTQKEPPHE